MGIFLLPTFSNNHHQESLSSGSPVVGMFLILSNDYDFNGSTLFFLNSRTAVGDIPKIVA